MEQDNMSLQDGASENTPKTFNVKVWMDANGNPIMQSVTEDELLNGYMRQADYTKKTQELSEQRKTTTAQPQQDDEDALVEKYLETKGYARKDVIESIIDKKLQWMGKAQQDENTISSIMQSNPDLRQFEWAIRKIAATDDSAIEDIIVKYGFASHDKLSKAKQRGITGGSSKLEDDKPKPISEWNQEDWKKFEATANKAQFR